MPSNVGLECTASHDMLHGRGSTHSNRMKMSDVGLECTASHDMLHGRGSARCWVGVHC